MSKIRKLASQTVLYGFTYIAGRMLYFFLTPFYTRILDRAAYGAMSEIYVYITFFNVLYTYGLETGYFYFSNKEENGNNTASTAFSSLAVTSIFGSGLVMLFAGPLARLAGFGIEPIYIIYAALILLFDTLAVIPFAQLRKNNKSGKFAMLKFLNIILNIFFNFLFLVICPVILSNSSLSWLHGLVNLIYVPDFGVGYIIFSNVLASGITLFMLIPEILKIKFVWNTPLLKRMLSYSWPVLILGFAGMINETLDRILLKNLLPLSPAKAQAEMAVYSAVYKLSIFMTLAVQSFRYAAEPFFFAQMKEKDSREIYARLLKYFSFATSLIFIVVTLFIDVIVKLIGKDFREGIAVVPILLLANLFMGTFVYLSQWYKQTGKTLYGAYISIGGAALTLLINILFIPSYGYMASAWATFACYFSMAIVSYFLGQKFYPVKYDLGRIVLYIYAAVVIYIINVGLRDYFFDGWGLGLYFCNLLLLGGYFYLFILLEKPPLNELWTRLYLKRKS